MNANYYRSLVRMMKRSFFTDAEKEAIIKKVDDYKYLEPFIIDLVGEECIRKLSAEILEQ